ncbi:MAG: hypothetical protein IPK93_02785 [Solirubrobacterales bacterium]|nr:hypothetical protein [Solirubrobacterales bacterium]
MSESWLLDNSAWSRRFSGTLSEASARQLADDLEARRLVVCLPFLLEAGYSARDRADHDRLMELFSSLPSIGLDEAIERRTMETQAQLVRSGHHRIPPVDVLIAAAADVTDHGVLHYDAHYDLILEQTDLAYESRWLAPPGTL